MFCDGQALPIAENEVLFQLIGTTYGGDGESTFNLPNLQSRVPIHNGTQDAITYQIGEMAGTEQETLTTQQIPIHGHALVATDKAGTNADPGGAFLAQSPASITIYIEDAPTVNMNSTSLAPVGGSQPHTNIQPSLCINFIISLFGVFPSPT
jgi:microcystin-dependent protein